MKTAVYAGSFDPITLGHLDIMLRAAKLFDTLYILVTNNIDKKTTFSVEERVQMIEKVTAQVPNIYVKSTNDLVVRFAEQHKVDTLIRGLRNVKDFEAEIALYHFNRNINQNIETIILFPSTIHTYVSSSAIKELVHFDSDISKYVPEVLIKDIVKGIKSKQLK
ncbi:MAG: pantetheine-phosphate adenylyltransferase [Paracholeplasma sp.]|nr:pantetheine-phosphate adenylyltransferase [Paracholeplasma sp.]MDY3195569.1 pantetheine-phosphate adenylyltransferase [Paracholeplasma sp.]